MEKLLFKQPPDELDLAVETRFVKSIPKFVRNYATAVELDNTHNQVYYQLIITVRTDDLIPHLRKSIATKYKHLIYGK